MNDAFTTIIYFALGFFVGKVFGGGYEHGLREAADLAVADTESKQWRDALIDARARKEKAKP